MLDFTWGWAFLFLPLPILVRLLLPPSDTASLALAVPLFSRLELEAETITDSKHRLSMLCISAFWICLIVACSRPFWLNEPISRTETGRDLMLAVDISGSMSEADMLIDSLPASRINALKLVVGRFIERRKGDRIGPILFGTNAYTFVPLTFDIETLNELLQDVSTGLAGRRTAIGDAIGLAVKSMREQETEHKVLILITDGSNTAGFGDPIQAALAASREGMTIYTIGVGSDEETLSKIYGLQSIPTGTALNEDGLKEISRVTNGRYFRATDSRSLEQIYAALDELEPVEYKFQSYQPRNELFYIPLLGGILIMMFYLALTITNLKTRKR
jgi:Ca-activated chloride channel family protein